MKSFVLTISATLLVILSVNAQISINRTDFPAIGDLVVTAMDDINTINPGQPGPNKTWEFVNLVPTVYDSTYYISPVGAPGYQNYPDANIVTNHNPNQYPNGYNINYWNFSEANMKGIADESLVNLFGDFYMAFHVRYLPPSSNLDFPIEYGDSKIQDFVMEWFTVTRLAGVVMDSAKTISHVNLDCSVDAWGTMNLPDGNFPVLRVKEVFNTIDSGFTWSSGSWVYTSDTTSSWTQYRWYANDYGEVGFFRGGSRKDEFTFFKSETVVGLREHFAQDELTIYPNPVSSELKVNYQGVYERIEILDYTGRVLLQFPSRATCDVSSLAPGNYMIRIQTGKVLITKRFVKI